MARKQQFKDFTGRVVGLLTVVSFDSWHVQPSGQKKSKWLCQCECGNTVVAMGSNLAKETHTTSCGCVQKTTAAKHRQNVKDGIWLPSSHIGKTYGRVTITDFSRWRMRSGVRVSIWKYTCSCGNSGEKSIDCLKEYASCGCWWKEKIAAIQTTHGMVNTPTYKTWMKMKERCHAEYYVEKENYQDKGITVCPEWLNSFENFLEDMGERPEGMTIDRIDNSLGYYKENCRWADNTIQGYNRGKLARNTSGRTGVFLNKKTGLYGAQIGYYNKVIKLARNTSYELAVKAREEGEMKYYGWLKE